MITEVEVRVSPSLLNNSAAHTALVAKALNLGTADITQLYLKRRTIDGRARKPVYVLRFTVGVGESLPPAAAFTLDLKDVSSVESAIVVGCGPAGMFAALRLIELGIKPIVLEHGKPVRERRRDIAQISKLGIINPESNYCFGEGGAGTFSDGKLYTRSHKRGSIERILHILVKHGASADILINAHPHIGTNKLPIVVQAMRNTIVDCGGEVHFNTAVCELISNGRITGVKTASGITLTARGVILATGHSARDVFRMLRRSGVTLQNKPFAVGVRVEHPQSYIDQMQYHTAKRDEFLPAASYTLRTQIGARGVFSFCMCPGGIICPAATASEEIVVNGWSPSKRNSFFANSGLVVEVREEDLLPFAADGPLAGLVFQERLENAAFAAGGGAQVAPAARLMDFMQGKISKNLPSCSYLPGIRAANLREVLPAAISAHLTQALEVFGRQRRGYLTNEAVIVATESRTSSPLRIPRTRDTQMHPELPGLFPCGEGAGYAGGIMSAAMDGENVAQCVAAYYAKPV